MRVVEGAQVLLTNSGSGAETALLKMVIALYQNRLRQAISSLPPNGPEEILAHNPDDIPGIRHTSPGAKR